MKRLRGKNTVVNRTSSMAYRRRWYRLRAARIGKNVLLRRFRYSSHSMPYASAKYLLPIRTDAEYTKQHLRSVGTRKHKYRLLRRVHAIRSRGRNVLIQRAAAVHTPQSITV